MKDQSIIKELKSIIAHHECAIEQCRKALRKLEGVSTPSVRKGIDKIVAQAVAESRIRRGIQPKTDHHGNIHH